MPRMQISAGSRNDGNGLEHRQDPEQSVVFVKPPVGSWYVEVLYAGSV